MSDAIVPIVADTDELSSGAGPAPVATGGVLPDTPNGPIGDGIELLDKDRTAVAPVRKTRSGTSSSGSSMKPSLSSRLDNLKISTIRQHYYPEGGWGWVICACAFVINMLTTGLLLSYGILYREVIKEFGEDYSDQAKTVAISIVVVT
ncbi:uncharacterized protein TNCT_377971 [Trichonephila clavata]|uniref:Monocarboxylate transporter n=1 Tax=Trichonephila clavata TaxID=2740835 RepID=A0A8X6GJG2_TRICU|nr:uncharacterized protein TNCT_377971 [Trichonephila clavata]